MTEDWDIGKFYADMVEYMPIASIRRKMKDDEKLKFTDSDKCTHAAFDQKEMKEDGKLRTFSDNLFQYLLPRRLNKELKMTLKDLIPSLHTDIGMSVLCCSYCIQKDVFFEILEEKLEIQNYNSIAQFFTNRAFFLHSTDEYNVFEKLRLLASITLELGVFCYLQGNGNVMDHCAGLYSSAFRYIFKNDFYANGGWNAWQVLVSGDVKYYEENGFEVETLDSEMITVSGWLKRFDPWIARLHLKTSCNQTESTLANNESGNPSDNVKNSHDATSHTTYDSKKIPDRTSGTQESSKLKCLYSKDCPIAKKFKNSSNYLILNLLEIISREKDSYEDLLQIVENYTNVEKLTRYCLLVQLIKALKECKLKMRNCDILQCMKLTLRDNARMAAYCFVIATLISEELDKAEYFKQKGSVGNIPGITAENRNRQETNSNMESVERSSQIKETSSSIYKEHEKLLDSFLQNIKVNDTSSASEICKFLSNKDKADILLTSQAFRLLMKETVDWPENRWEDEWILSAMTLLLNSQTNVLMHQPTVDGAQTESLANDNSVVHTNPQLIKSVQCSVTKRAQSSVPSVSNREDIERVCDDTNTEQVENLNQNKLSLNKCEECFDHFQKKIVEYILTSVVTNIREKETSVKKRTQKSSKSKITDETSVHKETSSTTKTSDTVVVDLPQIDYSEVASKDVKTHECET